MIDGVKSFPLSPKQDNIKRIYLIAMRIFSVISKNALLNKILFDLGCSFFLNILQCRRMSICKLFTGVFESQKKSDWSTIASIGIATNLIIDFFNSC